MRRSRLVSRWLSLVVLTLCACGRGASVPGPAPHASSAVPPAAPSGTQPTVVDTAVAVVIPDPERGDAVWRVHSSGVAERVWPPRGAPPIVGGAAGPAGSDRMLPSPDLRHVAYVHEGVLKVHDLTQGTTVDIARAPKPARGGKARSRSSRSPIPFITDWSPDGTELLYAFGTSDEPSHDDFFRYDPARATSTPVAMPGEFAGWLPTGELLVRNDELRVVSASGATRSLTPGLHADPQVALDAARTHLATFVPLDESYERTQLVSIDVRTAERKPLAPPQHPADLQWPRWSPSGAKIACLASDHRPDGHVFQGLWVDGARVGELTPDLYAHAWVDEDTIVLVHEKELVVLAIATGTVKGRTSVP